MIAKSRLKLKKVGKTTTSFRYDQIKSLMIIQWKWQRDARRTMDRGLWRCTEGSDQDHPQEKEMQKGKMVVWEGLANGWEKMRR